jgi:hypothetical protein
MPEGVLELVWLLRTPIPAWGRPRQDRVLEHLLLRPHVAVLARPRDKLRPPAWNAPRR